MTARVRKLPRGHIRARVAVTMEGPVDAVARKVLDILDGLPLAQKLEVVRQAGAKYGIDVDKMLAERQKPRTPARRRGRIP